MIDKIKNFFKKNPIEINSSSLHLYWGTATVAKKKKHFVFRFLLDKKIRRRIIALSLVFLSLLVGIRLAFLTPQKTEAAWYSDTWGFRIKLTIDYTKVSADQTDFPVYVDLSQMPASFHSHVNQTDARDIRVTKNDGTTELPREVVFYTAASDTGELHFKYTGTLSSTVNTDVYIYYGNVSASDYAVTDTYGRNNVWSNSYVSVYHLKESSGQHASSTGSNDSSSVTVNQQGANIGQIGQADDFDGVNDNINVPDADGLSINTTNQLTAEAWAKLDSLTIWPRLISKGGAGYTGYEWELRVNGSGSIVAQALTSAGNEYMTAAGSSGAVVTGTWYYLAVVYNFSTPRTETFKNGVSNASDTTTSGTYTNGTGPFRIGEEASGDYDVDGIIDEIRISSTARASTWLLTQYNNQNSPSTFFATGAAEEQKGRAVLNFAFDEGYGTTAHDSSPNGYIGTLSGTTTPSWQPEDLCMSGKCLYYEGSTAYTSVTTSVPNVQSVSFWVKPKTNGETLVDFDGGTHYITASSGTITASGFSSPTVYVNGQSGGLLIANAWQHVEVTTATAFTATNITIGKKTLFLNGFVDEFKVYDYARSAAQVKLDFNSRNSPAGVAARFGPDTGWISDGLVGYWKMDESAANTCGTNDSCDSSGNANDGAWNGNTANTTGKYGNGTSYDGTTDYTSIADSTSLHLNDLTVSAWFNTTSLGVSRGIISKRTSYGTMDWELFQNSAGPIYFIVGESGAATLFVGTNWTPSTGVWHHVVVTKSGTEYRLYGDGVFLGSQANSSTWTDSDGIAIGAVDTDGNSSYIGSIDEARIYNRALSPAEIQKLYNWAPGPVGWWKLDENTSTVANDISGNDNTGTLTNTPTWTQGKFGSAVSFAGSNQHIIRADDPDFDFGTAASFSYGAWIKHGAASAVEMIIDKYDATAGNGGFKLYMETDGDLTCGIDDDEASFPEDSATSTAATYDDGNWHHILCVKDGTTGLYLYIDGVLITSDLTISSTLDFANADPLYIGIAEDATSNDWVGQIDEVKIYNYTRTPGQVIEDMNAGHPAPGSPVGSAVAHWKFDEGYGTTAYDSSVNANNLTLSTASWTNSGKFGKAFNGLTNVRLSRTTDADLEFGATEDFTLSLWYKSDSANNPGAIEYLVNDGAAAGAAGYAIYANTDGTVCFGIDDDASWGPDVASCTTTDVYDNTWHHITAVRNVTSDTTKIYIDAVEKDSDTDTTTATLDSSPTFYIGDANATDGTDEFLGDIDEVKIFRSALTADAIKVLYNQNAAQSLGALSTDASNNPSNSDTDSYCPPGQGSACVPPVGRWKMDEGSWTNDCSTDTVFDSSGNGYNGDSCPNGTGPLGGVVGKMGKAGEFDGSNDYINVSSFTNLSNDTYTVSLWFNKRDDVSRELMAARISSASDERIYLNTTTSYRVLVSDDYGVGFVTSNNAFSQDTWTHLAYTYDYTNQQMYVYINGVYVGSDTAFTQAPSSTLGFSYIGYRPSTSFNGFIDDVRVYNYVRTPAQIAWDYNYGKPVGWWKMDENTGTTANDSMGNSTAGTLTNTPTWATGKLNSAVSFAGSNQHVLIGDDPDFDFADDEGMTLTTWFKHAAASAQEIILSKYAAAGYKIVMESDGDITCGLDYDSTWTPTDSTTSTLATYDDGNWHHITCVKTGATSLSLYIDGILIGTDSSLTATNTLTNADPLYLGIDADGTSNDFTGTLDDVRIYRYPLTTQQIKTVMNQDAVFRVAPVTGSP